jgi:hypothetical protein
MIIFRNGLKDDVKDKLIRTGALLQTISALILESIRLDDMLYDRKMEKKYNYYRHKKGYLGNRGFFKASNQYTKLDPYGHTPIELDIIRTLSTRKGAR